MPEEKLTKDPKKLEAEALAKVKELKTQLAHNTQDVQNLDKQLRERTIELQIRQDKLNQEMNDLNPERIKEDIKNIHQSIRDLQSRGVNKKAISKLQKSIKTQEELLLKGPKLLQNMAASQEQINNFVKQTDKNKNALFAKWEELNKTKKDLLQAQKELTIATKRRQYDRVILGAKKALSSLTNLTRRKPNFLEQMTPEDIAKFMELRQVLHKNKSDPSQKPLKQTSQAQKRSVIRRNS